eukprot:1184021-Prorocentrum_minimum.AAC.3
MHHLHGRDGKRVRVRRNMKRNLLRCSSTSFTHGLCSGGRPTCRQCAEGDKGVACQAYNEARLAKKGNKGATIETPEEDSDEVRHPNIQRVRFRSFHST